MADFGLKVKHDTVGKRLEIQCAHQNGLLYVVPSEASWVCSDELLHVHALAGFLTQLSTLNDVRVKEIMQRWGLYFRERPLAAQDEPSAKSAPAAAQDKPSEKPAPAANGAGEGDQEKQETPPISPMWLIIGFGLIFYFIVLAPQKKAKKKQQALVDSLKKHDRVVTIGGIVGTIVSIDTANEEVVLEVGPDTQLRLLRRSIQGPKPFGSDDEAESGDK